MKAEVKSGKFPEDATARLLPEGPGNASYREVKRHAATSSSATGAEMADTGRTSTSSSSSSPEQFKLAVFGSSGVGKTAITRQYKENFFVERHDPTIEDTYRHSVMFDGSPARLHILDTAGQSNYQSLRRSWMTTVFREQFGGFLFVFSLIDRRTFDELDAFYDDLMDLCEDDPPPSVLVANKADEDSSKWVVTEIEVRKKKANWQNCADVVFTSAATNRNISDAFESLCHAVRERRCRPAQDNVRLIDELQLRDHRHLCPCALGTIVGRIQQIVRRQRGGSSGAVREDHAHDAAPPDEAGAAVVRQ